MPTHVLTNLNDKRADDTGAGEHVVSELRLRHLHRQREPADDDNNPTRPLYRNDDNKKSTRVPR